MKTDSLILRPLLLNARDAAKALSICERTLWKMSHEDKVIPHVRIGKRVLYDPRDLTEWIDRQKGSQLSAPTPKGPPSVPIPTAVHPASKTVRP